jgi:hypothetical protein
VYNSNSSIDHPEEKEVKRIKIVITVSFVLVVLAAIATQSFAYPPFLAKSRKFGAKDCTFCHVAPEGGAPWNARGQWLIKEKERRGADSVDVEWLADYKEGAPDSKPAEDKKPAAAPTAVKVDPKVYDAYVGQYEAPFGVLTITKDGDKLFGAPEGEEKAELVPQSATEFDVPSVGVKVKFVKDSSGKVTHIVLSGHGDEEIQAKKIK